MKQTLQLRLGQHLTLTPQLQQSIRLLQLSTLELNAEVERMLQENPLLERAEGEEDARGAELPLAGPARAADAEPGANGSDLAAGPPNEAGATSETHAFDEGDRDDYAAGGTDWGGGGTGASDDDDDGMFPQRAVVPT